MHKELKQFLTKLNLVHGFYLDTKIAYFIWHRQLLNSQKDISNKTKLTNEQLDTMPYIYANEETDKKITPLKHNCTFGELIKRNKPAGNNQITIANHSIVLIYQYWEYYRTKLKKRINKEINSDIMGDIMYLRNSIIHNNGIGNKKIKKCKVINWHKENELIEITETQFEEIIEKIKKEIIMFN